MSQHPGSLLCPACRVDLVMSERQGVEIDYCPRCRGVWLDRGELDKILERAAAEMGGGTRPAPGVQPGVPPSVPPGASPYDRPYRPHDSDEYPAYGHHGYGKHRKRKSFLNDFFDFD